MKLLLTHSYFYPMDQKQWKNKTPFPPLATITALSVLKENGFFPEFYDVALDSTSEGCVSAMKNVQPECVIIYDDGFNYLTKMCLTNMRDACFEMIKEAKMVGAKVILSSSDATDHYAEYHCAGADFIIHGEGEQTLIELLDALKNKASFSEIEGISYYSANELIKTKKRNNLKELERLPMADWSAIDIEKYRTIWSNSKFPFTLNLSTTRGCPFKCNWCAKPIYGNRYNSRTPEHVVEELSFLVKKYKVSNFWITDDIFGLKPGWVKKFNALVQENELKIQYKIQSRADLLMQPDYIDDLVSSGLSEVWIGAESGSQKILDAMDKGISTSQIENCTKLLQEKGVRVAYFLQFGYTSETKEDIAMTLKMLRKNKPDDIGISVSYPLPGTVFYERVKSDMGTKTNWKDSDDLDVMFSSTYPAGFYKKLQRFVHYDFRSQQGFQKLHRINSSKFSWRYVGLLPYNFLRSKLLKLKLGI